MIKNSFQNELSDMVFLREQIAIDFHSFKCMIENYDVKEEGFAEVTQFIGDTLKGVMNRFLSIIGGTLSTLSDVADKFNFRSHMGMSPIQAYNAKNLLTVLVRKYTSDTEFETIKDVELNKPSGLFVPYATIIKFQYEAFRFIAMPNLVTVIDKNIKVLVSEFNKDQIDINKIKEVVDKVLFETKSIERLSNEYDKCFGSRSRTDDIKKTIGDEFKSFKELVDVANKAANNFSFTKTIKMVHSNCQNHSELIRDLVIKLNRLDISPILDKKLLKELTRFFEVIANSYAFFGNMVMMEIAIENNLVALFKQIENKQLENKESKE